jgi:hypothetical protein
MSHPRVVKIGEAAYDIFAARPSKWGNPFVIGIHGTREECIKQYEEWIRTRPELMAALPELRGKVLACYCAPRKCHCEILIKLLEEYENEKSI